MDEKPTLVCNKCRVGLAPAAATFRYLKRSFHHDVLRCPECGQVYLPEELVNGKIKDVEISLEDK